MILAKEFSTINVRKAHKRILRANYDYCIFEMSMPLKMSKTNLVNYDLHEYHKEIGVLLFNHSTLDKSNNAVLFEKKKALAQSFQHHMVVKLKQPSKEAFTSWIKMLEPYVLSLNCSSVMFPLNKAIDSKTISGCNLIIQELNSVLLHFALTGDIVLYQTDESISSLSYIIHSVGYPSKTSLCLNIDAMEKDYYTLKDIRDDIIKYDITNKVSMICSNKYSTKSSVFKEFLSILPDDIIVFGAKI